MSEYKQDKSRRYNKNDNRKRKPYYKNRQEQEQPKKRKEYAMAKKCPHCGTNMKSKGCVGVNGVSYWKCRNTKCGRTVKEFRKVTPPVPLVPTSVLDIKF